MVQEVRITNQTMYMHPAIEQARYQIMEQLFSWQAIVTSQNRIQSTRYQVGVLTAFSVDNVSGSEDCFCLPLQCLLKPAVKGTSCIFPLIQVLAYTKSIKAAYTFFPVIVISATFI